MQTIYLVKGKIENHDEYLCAVFSETRLVNKYIEETTKLDQDTKLRVEPWIMDFHAKRD
jgi:hypothetical protein